jgi:UDP-N-acetylmuramoyl-L-alanyl-D-glutamate--2,6-diaminopimelate ligase
MILNKLLDNVDVIKTFGDLRVNVGSIHFDSRKIKENDLFIALVGANKDGNSYIDKAISLGAKVIVCSKKPEILLDNITYILSNDTHKVLAIISSNFYDNPSKKIRLIGVTGTNGKTSVVNLLYQLFTSLNYKCGMISTIENIIDTERYLSTYTTPDPLQINALLYKMVESKCLYCFMEVSSHAIDQKRISYLNFTLGVFTNISHDHLDYHKNLRNYINTKKSFFDNLSKNSSALVNKDDKQALVMLQNSKASHYTFSLKTASDFKCKIIEHDFNGMLLRIDNNNVWVKLVGEFNAYNILAVYSIAILLKQDSKEILKLVSLLSSTEGRFQTFKSNVGVTAILDYAHTDDALDNVISTINLIKNKNQKLITVFGCGGDRDKLKRPKMTRLACYLSSKVILTSDNPRSEDIENIISDMVFGLENEYLMKTIIIHDRKQAIKTAFSLANEGDVILVAGKGHEKFQEIKGEKTPFDDKEQILNFLNIN